MLSLPLQSLVGNSHVRKVRRLAAAVCVGCLVLSGCSSGSAEAEGTRESASGSPFAEPEDPTPKIPDYTVEEGRQLSSTEKQLADEAVLFFTEYMDASNRAFKDGGVYWDRLIDLSSGQMRDVQVEARKDAEEDGFVAQNSLEASEIHVGNIEEAEGHVFVAACLHYDEWRTERTKNKEKSEPGPRATVGFDMLKNGDEWTADEISSVDAECAG